MFFAGYFFYCPFPYVCFTTFFSPSRPCSRFGLIWSRLSYDHGWIRSRPVSQVMRDKYKQYSFPPKTSRSAPITLTHKGSALLDDRVALRPHRMWWCLLADSACHGKHNQSSANQTAAASQTIGWIAKTVNWLPLLVVSPALHPPKKTLPHSYQKPGFGRRGHEISIYRQVRLGLHQLLGDALTKSSFF